MFSPALKFSFERTKGLDNFNRFTNAMQSLPSSKTGIQNLVIFLYFLLSKLGTNQTSQPHWSTLHFSDLSGSRHCMRPISSLWPEKYKLFVHSIKIYMKPFSRFSNCGSGFKPDQTCIILLDYNLVDNSGLICTCIKLMQNFLSNIYSDSFSYHHSRQRHPYFNNQVTFLALQLWRGVAINDTNAQLYF